MIDCVGDSGGCADIRELAESLDASRIHIVIDLRHENDINFFDIGVYWHQIIGKVVIDVSRALKIDLSRFVQRGAYAPDHSAHQLTVHRARVHEPPRGKRADDPWYANLTRRRMHANLDELGAHRIHHLFAMGAASGGVFPGIEIFHGLKLEAVWDEFGIFLKRGEAHSFENILKLLLSAVGRADLSIAERQGSRIAASKRALI